MAFEFKQGKNFLLSWDAKREEFIQEYGPLHDEKLVKTNWDRLEKAAFRFIIDLASYS